MFTEVINASAVTFTCADLFIGQTQVKVTYVKLFTWAFDIEFTCETCYQ